MRGLIRPILIVSALALACLGVAHAQSGDLAVIRSNLASADPAVRVEAMSACVASGRPAAVEMCETLAISSTDPVLRTLAVRSAFARLSRITVEVSDEALAQPGAQSHTNDLGMNIRVYDQATGRFGYGRYDVDSQVSGDVLTYAYPNCSGVFRREEGTWTFRGRLLCRSAPWTPQGAITLR